MSYRFHTSCVNVSRAELPVLEEMIDQGEKIGLQEFLAHVDKEHLLDVGLFRSYREGRPTLEEDWHLSFYRSTWGGETCYYAMHSGIEHVFLTE